MALGGTSQCLHSFLTAAEKVLNWPNREWGPTAGEGPCTSTFLPGAGLRRHIGVNCSSEGRLVPRRSLTVRVHLPPLVPAGVPVALACDSWLWAYSSGIGGARQSFTLELSSPGS